MRRKKTKLVIIHSYPTNSKILKGFYEFLSDYFEVYSIDLPGFVQEKNPLSIISIDSYVAHVQREIKKLELDQYWIGGISFGFLIANYAAMSRKCKGIIAVEPMLGAETLNTTRLKRFLYTSFFRLVIKMKLYDRMWKSKFFYNLLRISFGASSLAVSKIHAMLGEIHPKAFFETGHIIMNSRQKYLKMTKKPCVVIINPHDSTVDAKKVIDHFNVACRKVLVVGTTASHNPDRITKKYFQNNIQEKKIHQIISFVNSC